MLHSSKSCSQTFFTIAMIHPNYIHLESYGLQYKGIWNSNYTNVLSIYLTILKPKKYDIKPIILFTNGKNMKK